MVKKVKKTKAQIEEERILAEEAERKSKEIEDKRLAEEAEKKRLEQVRITEERIRTRKSELARLEDEFKIAEDEAKDRLYHMNAEETSEVFLLKQENSFLILFIRWIRLQN